ncbi:MAG: hypothetical protein AB1757_00525 [Acidobacteriota bacterium]
MTKKLFVASLLLIFSFIALAPDSLAQCRNNRRAAYNRYYNNSNYYGRGYSYGNNYNYSRRGYNDNRYPYSRVAGARYDNPNYYRGYNRNSKTRAVMTVVAPAAIGAGVGALMGGKKGAAVGALLGGGGGAAYYLLKRRNRY